MLPHSVSLVIEHGFSIFPSSDEHSSRFAGILRLRCRFFTPLVPAVGPRYIEAFALREAQNVHARKQVRTDSAFSPPTNKPGYLRAVTVHEGVAPNAVDLFAVVAQPPSRVPAALDANHHQRPPPDRGVAGECLKAQRLERSSRRMHKQYKC